MGEKEIYDPADIVKAYKHSTKYADDYKVYLKEYSEWVSKGNKPDKIEIRGFDAIFTLSRPAAKLCEKYNLRFPIDPNTPPQDCDYNYINAPIRYLIPMELMRRFDTLPDNKRIVEIIMSFIGKRLVLMIDTSVSRKQLNTYFNKIIKVWTAKSPKGIVTEDRMWQIYRMRNRDKKSLAQITRELYGGEGNPNLDSKLGAYYGIVKRQYKKACYIIKSIENPD